MWVAFERGQLVAYDMFFAAVVFIIVFGLVQFIWQGNIASAARELTFAETESRAAALAEQLVMDTGKPANWQNDLNSAEFIGLAGMPLVLDSRKLGVFSQQQRYELLREKMHLVDYNFSIVILRNSSPVWSMPECTGSAVEFSAERVVDYGGMPARLVLTLCR